MAGEAHTRSPSTWYLLTSSRSEVSSCSESSRVRLFSTFCGEGSESLVYGLIALSITHRLNQDGLRRRGTYSVNVPAARRGEQVNGG